jgi:SAM-dependent methyltransferase
MEWYEDEAFWEAFTPYMFRDTRFAAAEEECDKVLALAEFGGERILDLCCGPGRHSIALARRGHAVTGVDRTRFLLDKARERARAADVQVEWILEDMRTFVRPAAFDLALSMFTSFGYFEDPSEDVQVLRNIHHSLRPGGALVMDLMGKERLARVYQPASADVYEDGTLWVQRREVIDDWSRIRNEWILLQNGAARSFTFQHRIYSAQELKDRLDRAGFASVRVYGDLDGSPYGVEARRLLAVARKGP